MVRGIDEAFKRLAEKEFERVLRRGAQRLSVGGRMPPTPGNRMDVDRPIKVFVNSGTQTSKKGGGRSRTRQVVRSAKVSNKQKRGRKVSHRGKVSKMLAGGVYCNHEVAGTTSTENTQYIGHATCPPSKIGKAFWFAVLKLLYAKMNIAPTDFLTAIPQISDGDQISVYYKDKEVDALNVSTWTATGAGTDLYQDPYIVFEPALYGSIPSTNLHKIRFIPAGATSALPAVEVPLQNARLQFDVVSDLKFQNRSVNETGDEDANDVDHVPLQGKMYEGKGTGTHYVVDMLATDPFIANYQGVILKESGASNKEPPFGQLFSGVKRGSNIRMEAGEIKHSVLRWKRSFPLANIGQYIWNADAASFDGYLLKTFGLFRFYALEKMIVSGTEEIKTAYEHNLRIGCRIMPRSVNYTAFVDI